jgi:alpha-L-fucosidase 2
MFDAHPPFQIDGNFGCCAGIAEMFMQSHDTAMHILPALPDVWKDGKITGLRARGGFELRELEWSGKELKKMTILSSIGGNLRLRVGKAVKCLDGDLRPATGENPNPLYRVAKVRGPGMDGEQVHELGNVIEYDMDTTASKEYHFVPA